jgi:adenosyl cobinamide kinase/adenosyl cobinamide phosphate guanylyltransferase
MCDCRTIGSIMKLSDYMAAHGITDEQMAQRVGRHRSRVSRHRRGVERPDWNAVSAYHTATDGEVTANDWMDGPAGAKEAA